MSGFDCKQSEKLDEELVSTLSSLLGSQKSIGQKEEFLLKERKLVYDLLTRINEERLV